MKELSTLEDVKRDTSIVLPDGFYIVSVNNRFDLIHLNERQSSASRNITLSNLWPVMVFHEHSHYFRKMIRTNPCVYSPEMFTDKDIKVIQQNHPEFFL